MPALVLLTWYLLFGGEVGDDGCILYCNPTVFEPSCGEIGFEKIAARPVLGTVSDVLSDVSTVSRRFNVDAEPQGLLINRGRFENVVEPPRMTAGSLFRVS